MLSQEPRSGWTAGQPQLLSTTPGAVATGFPLHGNCLAGWILPLLPFTDGEAAPEKQSHQSGTAGHRTVGVASQPSSSPRGCATFAFPGELWEFRADGLRPPAGLKDGSGHRDPE